MLLCISTQSPTAAAAADLEDIGIFNGLLLGGTSSVGAALQSPRSAASVD